MPSKIKGDEKEPIKMTPKNKNYSQVPKPPLLPRGQSMRAPHPPPRMRKRK